MELPFVGQAFAEVWAEYVQHRIQKRSKLTPIAAKRCLKKLAGWGEARAIAALEYSIGQGWTGVFEPPVTAPSRLTSEIVRNATEFLEQP